ncbi:MAG: radical SAM protein [Candidatus Muiribacteriaceae bacterium]
MNRRLPCGSVFRTPVVRVDGSLTVCSYDLDLQLSPGNINAEDFSVLWESEELRRLRLCHLKGEGLPEKCRKCIPDVYLTVEEGVRYLKQEGYPVFNFVCRFIERPRVLLVNPPVSPKAPYKTTVTLGLGSIATYIREEYHVEVINMNHSDMDMFSLMEYIKEKDFNIVGFTSMTYQVKSAVAVAQYIKEQMPHIITVSGGVFATMRPEYMLDSGAFDIVVRGEGEISFRRLLHIIEDNGDLREVPSISYISDDEIISTPYCDFLEADDIPLIDRKLLPTFGFILDDSTFGDSEEEQKAAVVMFSRGCPSNCIFCESPHMWRKKVRLMSIGRIMKEIRYIIAEFGVRNFIIDDDSFTVFRDNIMEFCDTLIREGPDIRWRCNTKVNLVDKELFIKMKKAGCVKVTYGVESGNAEVLRNLQKHFTIDQVRKALRLNRETGLKAGMLMIIGAPDETVESVEDSIGLIEELDPEGGWDFQIMQPHPGTTLREEIAHYGGRILTDDWDEYYSDNITYIPSAFSEKEFAALCRKVTGRPVSIAGRRVVSFSENEKNIISIPVDMWEDENWDRLKAFYWKGEKEFCRGYTHTLGADAGFIEYAFVSESTKLVGIRFRACSQHTDKGSDVKLTVNGHLIGKIRIGKKDSYGFEYEISGRNDDILEVDGKINRLRLIVPEGESANGISIMYRALETGLSPNLIPITVITGEWHE